VDSATPILIEGEHIGNVFTGQLFFEKPDLDYFRAQARAYGFDEEEYIDAVKKVPIIPERAMQENLAFLAHLTGMLAEMGLKRAREQEAELRLRESVEDYRALFSMASDGIFLLSLDGTLIEVNESFARMHGYSTGEMMRMNIRDLDTPETAKRIPERIRRIIAGEVLTFEAEHYHKDGHVFPLEVSASLISYGGESRIQCLHRDITERKRAAERLRENEEIFKRFMEHSPIYVFFKDENIRALRLSKNYEALLGMPVAEMLGKSMNDLFPSELAKKMVEDDMRIMKEGKAITVEEELNGRFYSTIKFPIVIDGKPRFLAGYTIDVTERKLAEEEKRNLERQVQRAQKMESLGVLAGGIAHDFNNLLMVVMGHAELALKEISPISPAHGNLTEITAAARRAADLSLQMLAYAGKAVFTMERVGLRDLVEEMAHQLKIAISKKAILKLSLERGLPPIQADPGRIRQIVMNLIINASEAIGDRSGVITVSVGATRHDKEYLEKAELHDDLAPGLYVHLEVTDNGIGMDAETRSRIFDPFFSTKFTGRGLGLASVLGIVRAHKGAIKVYSEPGKGTTFKVLFPALTEGEDATRFPGSYLPADWRGKGTILLVDDEESLLALGARMLELLGFTVLTAADGLQAVDLYRKRGKGIDLVLMDLTMPHMDGAEAFAELRRLNPDVPIVLASGYAEDDVSSRFEGKRPTGIVQKPYTLARLREMLAGLMPKRPNGEG
jgi:PAS domain S-box-containing protein